MTRTSIGIHPLTKVEQQGYSQERLAAQMEGLLPAGLTRCIPGILPIPDGRRKRPRRSGPRKQKPWTWESGRKQHERINTSI